MTRAQSDCDALASPFERFQCRLPGVLHLLYVIAAALTVILIIVAAVAFRTYRRNQQIQDDNL